MQLLTITLSIFLSIFSTAVMSYISMATPIGPWIAPTLVLCAMFFFKLLGQQGRGSSIALITAAGSVGGILATGFGFSFPTLYFLDPDLFNRLMAEPVYFASLLTGFALAAGCFGFMIANLVEDKLIVQDELAFPIGQLVHKMIAATNQIRKAYELMAGFLGTAAFCFLQDGLFVFKGIIPKSVTLVPALHIGVLRIPLVRFDIWPLVWAIGFVTGHVIAIPLAVGALSKIFLVDPINRLFFIELSNIEFVLAFCSGMVLYGALISFIGLPKMIMQGITWVKNNGFGRNAVRKNKKLDRTKLIEMLVLVLTPILVLSYHSFSWIVQIYLLLFTFVCTYQIAVIAGKIGLAPLGRFATFVMVPAMLLFPLNVVHIVLIATFVEVCGGVAADILFGRKLARRAGINLRMVKAYQYLGLVISSLAVGVVFWMLINHFGLGSEQLFAYKAQSRSLLIDAKRFDFYALIIGAVFSFMLKYIKVNPMLVLGGLLMPIHISLGLIFGGMLTLFVKDREEWDPFWSGVFASNSVWMLFKSIMP